MQGDYLREVLESGICPKCERKRDDIDERYSFGYYAGVMCEACARHGFRDGCGLDQPMGNPQELDDYGNDGEY